MGGDAGARFVVTHHLATADHFDLRLEIGEVLVSWAVPKGPSTDPAVRRMAIRTDDHALDALTTEGVFGSQVVQQWDRGTFVNVSHDGPRPVTLADGLARGHLSVDLDGTKLHGRFTLIRTDGPYARTRESWLLFKRADADAQPGGDVVAEWPRSVLSGRTIEQVRDDGP